METKNKHCQFCGEEILSVAIKCKHCGSMLEGVTTALLSSDPSAISNNSGTVILEGTKRILGERYELIAELGRGGMGVVYKANDTGLCIVVAIKLLSENLDKDARGIELLKREARTAMKLSHPNIIKLYNYEEHANGRWLVMEYVDGKSLEDILLENKKLSEKVVRKYGTDICRALEYAHREKVIHRDIKPSNIMLDQNGRIKLADFGIARIMKDSQTRQTGKATSGTLLYMSPEQLMGRTTDQRSDIYSLGMTLYELLNGDPPFTTGDITAQHLKMPIAPLPEASEQMNLILQKCCAKEPSARFQTTLELRKALLGKAHPHQVETAGTTKASGIAHSPRQLRKLAALGTGALMLLLLFYLAYSGFLRGKQVLPVKDGDEVGTVQAIVNGKVAMEQARTSARTVNAHKLSKQLWQEAEQERQKGEEFDSRKEIVLAVEAYQKAEKTFDEAKEDAIEKAKEIEVQTAKKSAMNAMDAIKQRINATNKDSISSQFLEQARKEMIKGEKFLREKKYSSAEKFLKSAGDILDRGQTLATEKPTVPKPDKIEKPPEQTQVLAKPIENNYNTRLKALESKYERQLEDLQSKKTAEENRYNAKLATMDKLNRDKSAFEAEYDNFLKQMEKYDAEELQIREQYEAELNNLY